MAKHARVWNRRKYLQYINEGRGQGEKSEYIPWISIQDFSSKGIVSRVISTKTNRVHHFLSRNELNYFYLLEWSDNVIDIREQYPLSNVDLAINIAADAGINYPKDTISGFPYVLTCDFMITTENGLKARTIKLSSELQNKRTLEKLEIERRYWAEHGINWRVITEREIPTEKAKNIEWLHTAAKLPEDVRNCSLQNEILTQISAQIPVLQIIGGIEKKYGIESGVTLQILKHLLWKKQIKCDMETKIQILNAKFQINEAERKGC